MTGYAAPAQLEELNDQGLAAWSQTVAGMLQGLVEEWSQQAGSFFMTADGLPDDTGSPTTVSWDAYPSSLAAWFVDPAQADGAAEMLAPMLVGFERTRVGMTPVTVAYRQQDEYCEWRTEVDPGADPPYVRRVTFTSEAADYWTFLAEQDMSTVVNLYRQLLDDPAISEDDLTWRQDVWVPDPMSPSGWSKRYSRGDYNIWNPYNTTKGIVHLTHPDNTLAKAAALVASATVLRSRSPGNVVTDADELICAAGFGDPNRASDPAVGYFVNSQVRTGRQVGVGGPVGLYITGLRVGGFTDRRGIPVADPWRPRRGGGRRGMTLRGVFEVPRNLQGIHLDGTAITSGAQVARRLRMNCSLLVRPRPENLPKPEPQAPVATCVPRPGCPAYRGVFFPSMNWPAPPAAPTVPAAPAGAEPAAEMPSGSTMRWDSAVLNAIAGGGDGASSRWSRWSRWSSMPDRWSAPNGSSGSGGGATTPGPTRWSGTDRWS